MRDRTITLPGGVTVPVPGWTVPAFGVLAVVALSFGTYRYFYPVVPELVTAQQANVRLQLEVQHYNAHIFEEPASSLAADGLNVRVFADECLLVARRGITRLLVASIPVESMPAVSDPMIEPVVFAEVNESGSCPHQGGAFTWQYGAKRDQCWVEVWRTFQDGCRHMQMFNACSGAWDTSPDAIQWTQCRH